MKKISKHLEFHLQFLRKLYHYSQKRIDTFDVDAFTHTHFHEKSSRMNKKNGAQKDAAQKTPSRK